jgi:hypothetical protein
MREINFHEEGEFGWFHVPSYRELIDSFETKVLMEKHDDDYQGDSFYLLTDGERYGILVFGWGSCSGCDGLEACGSREEVIQLRDGLWNSITWRSDEEMVDYIASKDWSLEYYYGDAYFHATGKGFVHALFDWFEIPRPGVKEIKTTLPDDYMSNDDGPWNVSDGGWTGRTT